MEYSFSIIPNPGMRDFQKAAYRFNCIAQEESLSIVFVGDFAAKMLGSPREIRRLEVLVEPRFFENPNDENSLVRSVTRRWSQGPRPYLASAPMQASGPNTPASHWPIVVSRSSERRGIPLYIFPAGDVRECFRSPTGQIEGSNVVIPYLAIPLQLTAYNNCLIPVLQAHMLIDQRLRRFCDTILDLDTIRCDIIDINALLDYALSTYDPMTQLRNAQLFTVAAGRELLPLVRYMLAQAESLGIWTTITEVNKWRRVNIELGLEDIRSSQARF